MNTEAWPGRLCRLLSPLKRGPKFWALRDEMGLGCHLTD